MKNWVHHIVLSVSDVSNSTDFYRRALRWHIRSKGEDYTEFTPPYDKYGRDALFALVKAGKSKGFNSGNVGLHHFSFITNSREELEDIENRLKEEGIEMEEDGITDDGYGGTAIFCKDPDGMILEFHLR
ncbi:MAG: VOC family protein [Verrucomicrobiota bacterium]